ncbi:MAG TPA: CHASE3 domain-containing protein, partial [Tepidisphaeraceae bacterium]|nr:CHASE3 domain-containing protein [Tepidisphaeraceae bacterium]
MRWTVGTKIGAGFSMALAIVVTIGTASYWSTAKLTDTADWVTHTHKVLEGLSGLIQSMTDAETGQRGYLLTGDEAYLAPYQAGLADIDQNLRDVSDLTANEPQQQSRIETLKPLIAQRLAMLKEGIGVEKDKGPEAARQWVMNGKGHTEMGDIRTVIGDMRKDSLGLLKVRSDEAQASAQRLVLTIVAGTVSAFVILSIAGLLITRNISRPLKEITSVAERIAAGDLSVQVSAGGRRDEVGVMTRAFSSMIRNLRALTTQVAESVSVLTASASQISSSTTQLATSATEAATAVSETTATVEEVRQTAQLATQKAKSV